MERVAESGQTTKFVTMDGVRGVAALCVMLYHFTQRADLRLFPSGSVAVDIFFCLSGFVIAHSYEARLDSGLTLLGFARIRLIRLYPMYLLGLALGIADYLLSLRAGASGNDVARTVLVGLYGLLFLPTFPRFVIGTGADKTDHVLYPFNGPTWSLFFELACNGLFVALRPRGRALVLLLCALGAWFVATTLIYDGPCGWGSANALGGVPRALFSFYLGTALWRLWRRGALRAPSGMAAILPPALTLIVAGAPDSTAGFIVTVLLAVPAIVALATAEPVSLWLRRAYGALGEISYPLYAVHLPALGLTRLAVNWASGAPLDAPAPFAAKAALAVGLVFGCLALSRLYDRPARRALTARLGPASRLTRRCA